MHEKRNWSGRIRAFFPGKKAAKKPAGEPAWTQQQTICACNLHAVQRASGQKKNRRPAGKTSSFVFPACPAVFRCALCAQQGQLRGPARKRGTALLFQFDIVAFTVKNEVFCFSFDSKEKRFPPFLLFRRQTRFLYFSL